MIEVIPGIFESELEEIRRKVALAAPHVSWVQIGLSDGSMVPAVTFSQLDKFVSLIQSYPKLSFEAHLLVASPEKLIRPLVDAGFKCLIAHVEAQDPRLFLDEARFESVEVGLGVDGPSPLDQIEPFLEEIDTVLVMLAEAGVSGLQLQPENVEKVRSLRGNFPDLPIEVSQGINETTAKLLKEAGATRLVSTSFLFKDPAKVSEAIEKLRNA